MGSAWSCKLASSTAATGRLDLSVVIPTLNEASGIEATVASARQNGQLEVIVVDGGSTDDTVRLARRAGAKVIKAHPGRGLQQNVGWRASRGEWVLFLHGDTVLPSGYHNKIRSAINQRQQVVHRPAVWGCFRSITTDLPNRHLNSLLGTLVALRTTCLHRPYGDQAIFVRRACLESTGGLQEWPLLEDLDLVLRLNHLSPPVILPENVHTSARRWRKLGFWRTTATNQVILMGWSLGVPIESLAEWYRGKSAAIVATRSESK